VTTPPSRPPRSWNGEGEVLGVVPLLRAEGGEEESLFGLVAPEEVRPTEAETMILPLTPDEVLVVDVARGPDSGSMIEQAHRILMQVPYSVGLVLTFCINSTRGRGGHESPRWIRALGKEIQRRLLLFDCWRALFGNRAAGKRQ